MSVGLLFPGQGSQYVGMGKELYQSFKEIKNVYDMASDILGVDVRKISFEGPDEELCETKNTQIAILIMSLGILEVLKSYGLKSNISAGLSLGEYTALINSGYISFEDGIKLVRKRGILMQESAPEGKWRMASIIGLEDSKVENICKDITSRICCSCKL